MGALVACGLAVGLSGPASAAGDPDSAVTISELKEMALDGTDPKVMRGKIDSSGTIYRMTPDATTALRDEGVPASIISYMDLLYTNAVKHQPSLATSDEHWTTIGKYQYGGTPFGWPQDWVVGAPPLGASLKGKGDQAVHPPGADGNATK